MNLLILGVPNVGKTSLYNIICGDNSNIIHKTIGTTRDWHIASLKTNKNIKIYDTPGIIIKKNKSLDIKLSNIINEIDIILYVIDYKNNNYLIDKQLVNLIRKFNKEIILLVNKDDNFKQDKDLNFFGIDNIFYVSCSHNLGLNNFLNFLGKYNVNNTNSKKINFSIGLFGKTNVGKSTLLNKIVGYERSLVSDKPKTTTDIVLSSFQFKGNEYSIKDTAGLIKKNKIDRNSLDFYATKKTLSIIKEIDVNLFLIDINQGFDSQSKKIFNIIYNKSNIIIFIINKIDLIKNNKKKLLSNLIKDIESEFSQSKNIHILTISSLSEKDIIYLKKFIHNLTVDVYKKITTSKINQWLKKIINRNPHPRIKGKEVKFKYGTQVSNNPLTIKIFANFTKEISLNYKRFLINEFYNYFNMKSKKIKIIFSKSDNPYN